MKKEDILILALLTPVVLQGILIVVLGVGGFFYSLIVTLF
jgi:hypothetical protein